MSFAAIPAVSLFYSQVRRAHPRLNYSMMTTVTCPLLGFLLQIGLRHEREESEHPGWSSVPTTVEEGCLGLPTLPAKHGPKPTLKPRLARIPSMLACSQAYLQSTSKTENSRLSQSPADPTSPLCHWTPARSQVQASALQCGDHKPMLAARCGDALSCWASHIEANSQPRA